MKNVAAPDSAEESLERLVRTGLLYDFYGGLLTPKQRRVMELYYLDNLSLAEIAENEGVSRQAVFDLLRRSGRTIEIYEDKLGLLKRFREQQSTLTTIAGKLDRALATLKVESQVYGLLMEAKEQVAQLLAKELL